MPFSLRQLFRSNHWLIRFFASVKLTVVLLIAIGLACITGTLIPQADSITGSAERVYAIYVKRYGQDLHGVFNALSFYRLYTSWWFSVLLGMLAANMVVCALRRMRWRWTRLGFLLTHLSIVFLLAGVLLGLGRREGQMQIFEGRQSDVLVARVRLPVAGTADEARRLAQEAARSAVAQTRLDFAIHLDDFELRRHREPLDTVRVQSTRGGRPFSYNIRVQKKVFRAAGEPWDIEIVETMPWRDVEVVVERGGIQYSGGLRAEPPDNRLLLTNDSEIEYRRCRSREELQRLLAQDTLATTLSVDRIVVAQDGLEPTTLPLRLGVEQPIAGSDLTATILEFVPDWKMNERTREVYSATRERRNPAVRVRLRRGEATDTRWAFARFPDSQHDHAVGGIAVAVRFMAAEVRRLHFIRLLEHRESNERFVQRYIRGECAETTPGATGYRASLSGDVVMTLSHWATTDEERVADPDRFLAQVRLRNRRTNQIEQLELSSGKIVARGDLRFVLEREYTIEQFISHVRVIENGKTVLRKSIQMNDPLRYRGYGIFQSSYDSEAADASRYTILSVTRDPGTWFIYIGFGVLTVGLVFVFYINPWIRRKVGENRE